MTLNAENPHLSDGHFALGYVQEMRRQFDNALESYWRVLERNPSHVPSYAHVGHVLLQKGRARQGLDYVLYALRLGPRDDRRSHWLRFAGEAELELEHYDQSLAYLRESYELHPRQPWTLRALIAALAASGNLDRARIYLAELKRNAPHLTDERLLGRPAAQGHNQPEQLRGLLLALAARS